MSEVVTALTATEGGITAATFFTEIKALVPFIVLMIPVSLGIYFLRRMVRGAGKGKLKF